MKKQSVDKKSNKTYFNKFSARLKSFIKFIKNVIMVVGQLLIVVSISYSTTVVLIGIDSMESKISLAPQVLCALIILFKLSSKLIRRITVIGSPEKSVR